MCRPKRQRPTQLIWNLMIAENQCLKTTTLTSCPCASQAESAAESDLQHVSDEDPGQVSEGDQDAVEDPQRNPREAPLPPGSLTVWGNGYCTMLNDPRYPDCKISLKPRWCVDSELGSSQKSKTLTIRNFDADDNQPTNTYICLKAWLLQRCKKNSWHQRVPSRKSWYDSEFRALQRECQNAHLSPAAIGKISEWLPEVL